MNQKILLAIIFLVAFLINFGSQNALANYEDYQLRWTEIYDSGFDDNTAAIAVDDENNLIVAGITDKGSSRELVIIKYDDQNNQRWLKPIATSLTSATVAVDNQQNIIIGGTIVDAYTDVLLAKYNPDGEEIWSRVIDYGGKYNHVSRIAIDSKNNIVVGGTFNDTGDQYDEDYYVVKYDENGNFLWDSEHVVYCHNRAHDLAIDSEDNVIQAGQSPCNGLHAVKYSGEDGQIIWSTAYPSVRYGRAAGVAIDSDNNVYLTGYESYWVINGCGEYNHDMRTIKLDSDGNIKWVKDLDSDCQDLGWTIAIGPDGNIYVLGTYDNKSSIVIYDPAGNLLHKIIDIDNGQNAQQYLVFDGYGNFYASGYAEDTNRDFLIVKYSTSNAPPTAPQPLSPYDGETDINPKNTAFEWSPSTDPEGDPIEYCVTLNEDIPPLNTIVYDGCAQDDFFPETTFTLPINIEPTKTYLWTVLPKDENGNEGEVSEPSGFTTEDSAPTLIIEPQALPKGEDGQPYSAFLQVTGGTAPFTWSIARGSLPDGLALFHHLDTSIIEITGTPATLDQKPIIYNFAVKIVDANQHIATHEMRITIRPELKPSENYEAQRWALILGPVYVDRPELPPDDTYDCPACTMYWAAEFHDYLLNTSQWKFPEDNVFFTKRSDLSWVILKEMLDTIESFMNPGDHFLLYISGHGWADPTPPYGNEVSRIDQEWLYWAYEQEPGGLLEPRYFLNVRTSDDEFFQLPALEIVKDPKSGEDYLRRERIYDDDLTDYFNNPDTKWSTINKHFFFDFCNSGGFYGGKDAPGDFENLEKIAFVAATPEGYLSKEGRLWNYIDEAVKQKDFDYTFKALYRYLDEQIEPRFYEDFIAAANPEDLDGYIFRFLQYPVTYNDNLIEDVPPNRPPIALCQDISVPTEPDSCTAPASIDAGSYDPDGDPITIVQTPAGPYALMTTDVELTVSDDKGLSATCTTVVTIVDNTPPEISLTADPDTLWPPNHKMRPITVTADAVDNCDPNPVCQIVQVESNESEDDLGKGNKSPDWQITGDLSVNLRAERFGTGSGRVYIITVECADASGNTATADTTVSVPHDKGKSKKKKLTVYESYKTTKKGRATLTDLPFLF